MDVANSAKIYDEAFAPPTERARLSTTSLLATILAFYAERRFDNLITVDGDMLIFEFGTYDWGHGKRFEVGLKRQFIEVERDDDDKVFSTFRLTCLFDATAELDALGSDEKWCADPTELKQFAAFVDTHPIMKIADTLTRRSIEVGWGLV